MKQSIWVLDDEECVQTLIEKSIKVIDEKNEFEVKKFYSASVVLAHLSYSLPDILLVDLGLNGLDGIEFIELISMRADFDKVQLYVVSNSVDHNVKNKVMQYGIIKKYISKPISLDNVSHIIKNCNSQANH